MTRDPRPDERNVFVTLHRIIDAPVETVWAAWTDPELLQRWLAPGDATVTRVVAEVRVAGTFLVEMRGPDGKTWATRGSYREVVPNRRLAHTWRWEGSDVESLVTVEFEPGLAGTTSLTLTHSRFTQAPVRDEHRRGWTACLAKLEALCAGGNVSDMTADDVLISRIRAILTRREGYSERRMFGTVCFMIDGNMCAGTWNGSLFVRLDRKCHDATLAEPHTRPADMSGRVMRGWALIEPAGIESDDRLAAWLERAARFAGSLPARTGKRR